MAGFAAGAIGVDFDSLDLTPLADGLVIDATPTSLALATREGLFTQLFGTDFVFAGSGPPTAGVITDIVLGAGIGTLYQISGLSLSAETFRGWVLAGENTAAVVGIFAGSDTMTGSPVADRIRGFDGEDTLAGGGGDDILDGGDGDDDVFGGMGSDTLVDPGGGNYLRGDEGDDYILGGAAFDDINGNMGADTADGGFGDDWVVGGKDQDLLFGDAGDDLVYGNLGNDTLQGGSGADTIRGGQDDDSLSGGGGNDFISGDRGADTMAGGLGADIFHSFGEAGIDRVLDFSVAEGDRVLLDAGTAFMVAQLGSDTVITMDGGQVVLVGVAMSSLLRGSIFLN